MGSPGVIPWFSIVTRLSDTIVGRDRHLEPSETVRQTPTWNRCGEDTVRAAWRHAESGRNDLATAPNGAEVTKLSVPIRRRRRRFEESCP